VEVVVTVAEVVVVAAGADDTVGVTADLHTAGLLSLVT
jgi:hypothetical protein